MKEDDIQSFMSKHKESIPGEAFNARLFNTLDCLPQPQPRKRSTPLVVACSALLGFLLSVLLGGYEIVLKGLSSLGSVFVDISAVTPEVLTACILLVLAMVGLGGFAYRTYRQ